MVLYTKKVDISAAKYLKISAMMQNGAASENMSH